MLSRRLPLLLLAVALVLAAGYWTWSASRGTPQNPGDSFEGTTPREGVQMPGDTVEAMDEAHRKRVEMFPAPTEARGMQPLEPRIDDDGALVFELEASVFQWEVEPGVWREAWGYNGVVPGPTIRVREGDRVRVHLTNNLPESTTIHWHGQHMRGYNAMDGVSYVTQPPVKPGEKFTYEFVAYPPGTHMYHSHHNSARQVAMGLLGPLIVDPKDPAAGYQVDREYILVLNDGPLGYTLNGKSFPATEPIRARVGERILLRWMNEGALVHPMHVHGMAFTVVARDGYPQPQPWQADTINIAPGERWDTIIEADNPGVWAIHCHVLPHAEGEHGMFGLVTLVIIEPVEEGNRALEGAAAAGQQRDDDGGAEGSQG